MKGVLREQAEATLGRESEVVLGVFGPPTERAGDFRGGVVFGDAWPLLVPVRSLAGTFAWVTCPQALRRLAREVQEAGLPALDTPPAPASPGLLHLPDPSDGLSALRVGGGSVLLDDLVLSVKEDLVVGLLAGKLAGWIWSKDPEAAAFLKARVALVHDDVFAHFCRHGMEVRARVALDRGTGTVAQGPWTEEHIPAETILCGLVRARGTVVRQRRRSDPEDGRDVAEAELHKDTPVTSADALANFEAIIQAAGTLRFGGHASVGLGRARLTLLPPSESASMGAPAKAKAAAKAVGREVQPRATHQKRKGGRR